MTGIVALLDVADQSVDVAALITAGASVLTALGGLVIAVAVLIPTLRNTKRVNEEVARVHTIVNQQRTDAQRFNIALMQQLKEANIVPVTDQSLPVPGTDDAEPGQPT